MILVTVGTEQYPFNALMDWIDLLIRYGAIDSQEEVVVQYGASTRLPDGSKIYRRLTESDFRRFAEEARLVIAHCGEGTTLLLEALGKPYILVPRSSQFGEHVDDHQLEMADAMQRQGVSIARSPADLVRFLAVPKFSSVAFQSETALCDALSKTYGVAEDGTERCDKIMLVCSAGGHFTAMQSLKQFWDRFSNISWVTFRTPSTEAMLKPRERDRVYWAYHPTNRNIPNLIRNLILAIGILRRERPDIVVSTGAGVAVPFLLIARHLFGSKVVFVESKTRLKDLSLSAKLLRVCHAYDHLIVQSSELAQQYPDAVWVPTQSAEPMSLVEVGAVCPVTRHNQLALITTPRSLDRSTADALIHQIESSCELSAKTVVLDMSATQVIDRVGLGALLSGLRLTRTFNVELSLWGVLPGVMAVLKTARLERVFKVEEAATAVRNSGIAQPLEKPKRIERLRASLQRGVELTIALLGLLVTALLLVPIAIGLNVESRGPIFVGRLRRRETGELVRVWQFRTTDVAENSGSVLQTEDNCGILDFEPPTRVGRLLRFSKIEKLPLLLSIFTDRLSLKELRQSQALNLENFQFNWAMLDAELTIGAKRHNSNLSGVDISNMEEYEDIISL